ncbi:MAG: MGMT family protein [Saprospiraceae bacterium]|jgi:methylated-DNA-protein-cysteine methyltransferase-like protein|nr:MGMT family protein [Saprospiraceae bacterium]MBK6564952.1 MGMT family protein [Saprospiraceae bacterium]MBK6783100.1 MGMT family protein [Saprospiraceae bacterium]MBK7523592.1 MGMT family protein [Saprospiraceae bacterium]MBK8079704.1 MGMT family protein [Saprospiraceae bacterium]
MKDGHYFQQVYDVTCLIPEGRVSTYGAIADFLALGSARMVGWALNNLKEERAFVPAHRVVNREGFLSGKMFFNPPSVMQERLEKEGVKVKNDKVLDFDKIFWHPRILDEL